MLYQDLIESSKRVLENHTKEGKFRDLIFRLNSGGIPGNPLNLPVVYSDQKFLYDTQQNGEAFAGDLILLGRATGTQDADYREIYEHENGTLFVFDYTPATPEKFDSGRIIEPRINLPTVEEVNPNVYRGILEIQDSTIYFHCEKTGASLLRISNVPGFTHKKRLSPMNTIDLNLKPVDPITGGAF